MDLDAALGYGSLNVPYLDKSARSTPLKRLPLKQPALKQPALAFFFVFLRFSLAEEFAMSGDSQTAAFSDPVVSENSVLRYKTCSVAAISAVPPERRRDGSETDAVVGIIGSPDHAVTTTLNALWENGTVRVFSLTSFRTD
jgi:hypothetical protein